MKSVFASKTDRRLKAALVPIAAILSLQVLGIPTAAALGSTLTCEDLFERAQRSTEQPAATSARSSFLSEISARAQSVSGRFSFKDIVAKRGREIYTVVQSSDGRYAAVEHAGEAPILVDVIDLKTGEVIRTEGFTNVKSIHFVPGKDMIAVSGSRIVGDRAAKLFMFSLSQEAAGNTEMAPTNTVSNPTVSLMDTAMAFWFGGSIPSSPAPSLGRAPDYLSLPGSSVWGVSVTQVESRPDLRHLFVIQNRSITPNASVFDPATMRPTGSLRYDGLTPVQMNLNPRSTLAAVHLVDPVIANKQQNIIGLIDANRPDHLIYKYDIGKAMEINPGGFTLGGTRVGGYTQNLPVRISTHWTPDGKTLAMFEATTGTVVKYDTVSNTEAISERGSQSRWPISGGTILSDGSLFVLRQGDTPTGTERKPGSRRIFGYIADAVDSLDGSKKPDFELQYKDDENLFPISNNKSEMIEAQGVFEMLNGRVIVVVLDGQVITINRADPSKQSPPFLLAADDVAPHRPLISSAQKIDESTLRISDRKIGIIDIRISDPWNLRF